MIPMLLAALANQGLGALALKYGAQFMSNMRTQEQDAQTQKQTEILGSIFGDKDMSTPEGQQAVQKAMLMNPLTFQTGAQLYQDRLRAGQAVDLENVQHQNRLGQIGAEGEIATARDRARFQNEWDIARENNEQRWRQIQAQIAAERDIASGKGPEMQKPPSGYQWTPSGSVAPIPGSLDYKKAVGELRGTEQTVADMNELINLFDQYGTEQSGPVSSKMQRLYNNAIKNLSLISNTGVINPTEMEAFKESLPDPTDVSFFTGDKTQRAKYEALRDVYQKALDTRYEEMQDYGIPFRDLVELGYMTRVQ